MEFGSEKMTPDFKRMLEGLPGVYWMCGADGACSYASPQLSAFTGLAEVELLGSEWKRVIHPNDRRAAEAAFGRPGGFSIRLRVRSRGGTYRRFEVHGHPELDGGQVVGWSLAGRELPGPARLRRVATKRRERQASIASDDRLRRAYRATHDVILDLDVATKRVGWNEAVEFTFGYPLSDVPARLSWWSDQLHPEDLERVTHALETSIAEPGMEHWSCEYRFRHRDGHWMNVLHRAHIQRDDRGRATRVVGSMVDVTARERAADAQSEREEHFRYLANAAPLLVWTMRTDGHPEYVNERWYEYTGISREDAGGERWAQLIHPEDAARALEAWRHAARTGEPYEIEYRLRRGRDGAYRWFLSRAVPMRDAEGNIVRWFGTSTDIDDHKRVEADLEQAKTRLEVTLAKLPVGVFIANAEGIIYDMNSYAGELWGGVELPLRLGACPVAGYRPGCAQPLAFDEYALSRALFRGEDVVGEIIEVTRSDGGRRTILTNAAPFRDGGGGITGAVAVMLDVTDWRRAEQALRESEARARDQYADLEQVYRTAPVGLFTLDREYRFQRVNERIADIDGLPVEAHVGKSLDEVVPALAGPLRELLRPVVERGEPVLDIDVRGVTPTTPGIQRDWLGSYYPLRATSGQVVGLVGAVLETTERRRAERALRESEERLRQADHHKNEFLAMLSHELRNPLAPIRSSVFILNHAPAGGEQARRALQVIERQTCHLTRLIDDLLDVTRISRGKIHLQRESVELNQVVQAAADDVRELFARSGIELDVHMTTERLRMDADRTRVAQVVDNLLQNAAKFTPRGGRVELSLARTEGHAILEVSDTGVGLEPALVDRLFEPFVQADKTLDRTRGGLGLGLALVRGLVELHGGTVCARSDGPGRGATFTVRLPTKPPECRAAAPHNAPVAARHGRRVLIVEDNQDAARSLRDALELIGHTADVAFSGTEGIRKALETRPEVVVCDIGLPEMDGYGVAQALRRDPALGSTYLVALSGYALPEDTAKMERAGFNRHLAKPPDMEVLERILGAAQELGPPT